LLTWSSARSPVHSVLWLILAFLSSAGLFVLLGAEFVAMLLIIVYVGAVAVLFLFVVMMLDVDFAALKAEMVKYIPLGADRRGAVDAVGAGLWRMGLLGGDRGAARGPSRPPRGCITPRRWGWSSMMSYFLLFQLAGLILLVAMIGAIVLTLRHRADIKRQDILAQMYRDPAKAMELKDVKPGQGL
jgi:NADH-quinone oxidoreductase subunit J